METPVLKDKYGRKKAIVSFKLEKNSKSVVDEFRTEDGVQHPGKELRSAIFPHRTYRFVRPSPGWVPRQGGRVTRTVELYSGIGKTSETWSTQRNVTIRPIDWLAYPDQCEGTEHRSVPDLPRSALEHIFGADIFLFTPPCVSVTRLAQSKHKRSETNGGQGAGTDECEAANRIYQHLQSWLSAVWSRGAHRVLYVFEAPLSNFYLTSFARFLRRDLGAHPVVVDWCAFGSRVRKRTVLWTNSGLLRVLAESRVCQGKKGICSFTGQVHEDVRGNTHQYLHFPLALAQWIANTLLTDHYILFRSHMYRPCTHRQCRFFLNHPGAHSHE